MVNFIDYVENDVLLLFSSELNRTNDIKEAPGFIKSHPNIFAIKAINFTPAQLKALSDSGNLPNINTIILVNYPLDCKNDNGTLNSEGVKVLAELSNFSNLTELSITIGVSDRAINFDLYRFNSKNIEYIKDSPIFKKLSQLNINCKQGAAVEVVKKILEYLVKPESAPKLQHLTIGGDYIDPAQEEQLAEYCFQNDKFDVVNVNPSIFFNMLKEIYKKNNSTYISSQDATQLIFALAQVRAQSKNIYNPDTYDKDIKIKKDIVTINDIEAREDKVIQVEDIAKIAVIVDIIDIYIQHMIEHQTQYPVPINSPDGRGYPIWYYYKDNLKMLKIFFKHGATPDINRDPDPALAKMAVNRQTAHDPDVLAKNDFYTKKLIEKLQSHKEKTRLGVNQTYDIIEKLKFTYTDNKQIALLCLSLTNEERRNILIEKGRKDLVDDKVFIDNIINNATKILKESPIIKGDHYLYEGSKKTTILQLVEYILLYIEQTKPSIDDKRELCLISCNNNEEQITQKFDQIKTLIPSCNIEQLTDKKQRVELVTHLEDKDIDILFNIIHDVDLVKMWQDQRRFILAKQIFLAIRSIGEDSYNTFCPDGIYGRIIQTLEYVHPSFLEEFHENKAIKYQAEVLKPTITKMNVDKVIDVIVPLLIKLIDQDSKLHQTFAEFVCIDNDKSKLKNQPIYVVINSLLNPLILGESSPDKPLPNYNKEIPSFEEYDTVITAITRSKMIQKYALRKWEELQEVTTKAKEASRCSSLSSDILAIGNIGLTNVGNSESRKRRYSDYDTQESQEPKMKKQAQEAVSSLSPDILPLVRDSALASGSNVAGRISKKRRHSE